MKPLPAALLLSLSVTTPLLYATGVDVQIKLSGADALELSYRLPPTCARLPFVNAGNLANYAGVIRAAWQALDACGAAPAEALLQDELSCQVQRFKVPATSASYDRVYPGSFPMGQTMYVHTGNYAVTDACGPVSYHFMAPGGVALEGRHWPDGVEMSSAEAGYMPILLLQKTLPASAGALTYFDTALGEKNIKLLQSAADESIDFYRFNLKDAALRMPILAATSVADPRSGSWFWGDAADVLRLSFYNWPQQPDPKQQLSAKRFVAHEFSHRFQPQHGFVADLNSTLISEGGAEFLRWTLSIQKNWLSKAEAAQELDQALAQCLIASGDQSWGNLSGNTRNSGQLPYQCGLVIHAYGLAARQSKLYPLQHLNAYYRDIAAGKARDFGQTMECGESTACQAKWLPRWLGKGESMGQIWKEFFVKTGLAEAVTPDTEQQSAMQVRAFSQLMAEDCGGNVSFFTEKEGFRVAEIQGCQVLRQDMFVIAIEGVSLLTEASPLQRMADACQQRGELKLGLKNGASLSIACKQAYHAQSVFYKVNMDYLLKKLAL